MEKQKIMHNHHRLFIAGLALLLTGLLFISPAITLGATNAEDGSGDTGGGGGTGEIGNTVAQVDLQSVNIKTSPDVPYFVPNSGGLIGFYGYWKNNSNTSFTGKLYYKCYINNTFFNDGNLAEELNPYLDYSSFPAPLAPGETSRVSCDKFNNLAAGTYQVRIEVDANNSISESNENNNSATYSLQIGASAPTPVPANDLQIKDQRATGVTHQSAIILWRTNAKSSGRVYYRSADVPSATSSTSTNATSTVATSTPGVWKTAEDRHIRTNHEVKLSDLLPGTVYSFYVVSGLEGQSTSTTSETKSFTTRVRGNEDDDSDEDENESDDESDDSDDDSEDIVRTPKVPLPEEAQLRKRIKKLQLRVTELERKLLEREKSLAQKKDDRLTNQVKGKLLLDVEKDKGGNGEAWYVDPITSQRFYLKDGESAYKAMQAFGLGINTADLQKIAVGVDDKLIEKDTDSDGLSDDLEEAQGTDVDNPDTDGDSYKDGEEVKNQYSPKGSEKMTVDAKLCQRLSGRVVIDVANKGRAWYIKPENCQRYYLRNGEQAYKVMRYLSTGVTRENLNKIEVGTLTTEETR